MALGDAHIELSSNEMLLDASENLFSDKIAAVKTLLKSNRELFAQEVLDRSLLSCCKNGILLLMPAIISAGANLETTDKNRNTPLLVCALNSHERCAKFLIMAGANVNAVNLEANTPLIASVLNSASIGVTKHLVGSTQTNIDHVNKKGYTALLYAIETANLNAIKLLIDAGASIQINEISPELCLSLEDLASRKGLLRLLNLFQLQKVTGKSCLLHATLARDIESAEILTSMDDSIMNTGILIELLNSIKENNNVVTQSDVQMLEVLLNHYTADSLIPNEKEIIMDIAISIGNHEIVESLFKLDFVISCEHLIPAISKSDFLRLLLTKRHIINKFDLDNQPVYVGSPLHRALQEVEMESARALIQHGAFIDIDQALEDTVKWNQAKTLQFIISEFFGQVGPKLRSPKLLHIAVINSALNIIPILLDHGADINAEYNGKYCLTQVVDLNVLKFLLSRGADPNIRIGSNPYTYPIHMFLSKEFKLELKNKRKSLQASGVTNSFLNNEIKAFVQCLLKHGADVDLIDFQGQTALHIAAGEGHTVGLFKILLDAGADVNIMDNNGQTPLHISADNNNIGKLKCLLHNKATIDLKDNLGRSALQIAADSKTDSADILKLLIDSGFEVNTTDNFGDSPLSRAVLCGNNENVKTLIAAGADINFVRQISGKSVLFDATNQTILETLLDNGADISTINGESPLSSLMATSDIAIESVKRLIDAGCDVNHVNKDGDTVLIIATYYYDIKLLELLVEKGADVNATSSRDITKTAVIELLSQIINNPELIFPCVEYLIDHNANIDNVHFAIMHVFITFGCLSLIPKFISRGCVPTYLLVKPRPYLLEQPDYSLLTTKTHISPLMMALLMDQSELAQYFINIKYLMASDIAVLNGDSDTQRELEENSLNKSLDLLKTVGQQPLSLETLCSVVISDILGPTRDRRLKIQKLELTQPVKDLLLFKNVGKCDIKNVGKTDDDLSDIALDFYDESFEG